MSPTPSEAEGEAAARRRVSAGGLFVAAGWVLAAVAGLSALGQRAWPLELIVHFWPQLGLALLVTGLVSARAGHRVGAALQVVAAATLLGFVGANVVAASSSARPEARAAPPAPALTALFANVAVWNDEHERLVSLVQRVRPDVIGLVEIDHAWLAALGELDGEYPHRAVAPRPDEFGIGLLSRLPLSSQSVQPLGRLDLPSIVASLETPAGPWRVIVTHPVPPFHEAAFDSRNSLIGELSAAVAEGDPPTVVLADLNATLWSPYVRDLRDTAGLGSAAAGLRAFYTWPTALPPLALGLDHCLVNESAVALEFRVLEGIGSDHFPILCAVGRRTARLPPA